MRPEYQRLILPIAWAGKKILIVSVIGVAASTIYYASIFKYRVNQTIYIQEAGEGSLQNMQMSSRSSGFIRKSKLTKSIIRSLNETNWKSKLTSKLGKNKSFKQQATQPPIVVIGERLRISGVLKFIEKFFSPPSFSGVVSSSISVISDPNSNITLRVHHYSPHVAKTIANAAVIVAHQTIVAKKLEELKETDTYIKTEIANIDSKIEAYEKEFSNLVRLNFETTNSLNSNDTRIETQLDSKITSSKIEYESIIRWFALNGFPQESFFNENTLFDGLSQDEFNPLFRQLTKLKTLYEVQTNPTLAAESAFSADAGNLAFEVSNLEKSLAAQGLDVERIKKIKTDLPDNSELLGKIKKMIDLEQYIEVASNMLKSKTARSLSVQQIELKKLANIRQRDHLYRILNNLSNRELDLRMDRISQEHKYDLPSPKSLNSAQRTPSGSGIVLMSLVMVIISLCMFELLQDKIDPLVIDLSEFENQPLKAYSTVHESDTSFLAWLKRTKNRKFPQLTPQFLNDIKILTNKIAKMSSKDGNRPKIIGLTSTVPGEGKSFLGISIAMEYNHSHGKALLIDGDLIASRMDQYLINKKGCEILMQSSDFRISRKPNDIDLLEPITADISFRTIMKLFEENSSISNYIDKNYDLVLIDLPPVQLVPDAYRLLSLLNDLLYVISSRSSKRSMIINSIGEISQMSKVVPKIILNRSIKPYQKSYYDYGGNYLTTRKRAKNVDKAA